MKISVIIPVYNAEKYLEKLLNSIFEQTYFNYEIIMVNDGSTDNSEKIIKKIIKNKKNCKLINQKNSGPGIARKNGFLNCSGQLLFFIDSDDYIPNRNAFEKINFIFSKNIIDILFFNYEVQYSNKKEYKIGCDIKNINFREGIHDVELIDGHSVDGSLCSKIFLKEKMQEDYFYPSNNFEDMYTSYNYLNNCKKFYYSKSVFYHVNRNDNISSLTRTITCQKIDDCVNIINKLFFEKNFKLKKTLQIIAFDMYIYHNKNLLKMKCKEKKKTLLNLKTLRKIFKSNAVKICLKNFSFKRLIFYYYITINQLFL